MEMSAGRLSAIGVAVSIVALVISGATAWFTTLRPARISSVMPHCVMWQFSSWIGDRPSGDVGSRQMTPYLIIRNLGARPVIIEDLRIRFITDQGDVAAYPVRKVPNDVIEAPGNNRCKYDFGEGAPFSGIILSPGEGWTNSYAFSMDVKSYELLKGDIRIYVEIRKGGNEKWKEVLEDVFAFGSMPYHLRPLKGEGSVAGSMNAHVYSKRWNDARAK
ncbi:hypothetical protein BAC3_00395 [uncultured bacterium]|nr:hypothetical protein BAC3_00395 [uncultured bacterium]